jgi:hypothetical protein
VSDCIHPWPHDEESDEVLASLTAVRSALRDAIDARRKHEPFAEQWGWVHVVQENLAYVVVLLSQDEDAAGPALKEIEANGVH